MKIKECKAIARRTLIGRYGTLILAGILSGILILAVFALAAGCAGFTLYHAGLLNEKLGTDAAFSFPLVSVGVVAFLLMLIFGWIMIIWLDLGRKKLFLNLCRGAKYGVGDIFHAFRAGSHPWKYVLAMLILMVIALIFGILPMLVGIIFYFLPGVDSRTALYITIGIRVVTILLLFYFMTAFLFVRLILADKPDIDLSRAFSKSRELMKGRKLKGFWLICFSFLFWIILMSICRLTSLWIIPYIECTLVVFYLDADGSLWQIPDPDYPAQADPAANAEAAEPVSGDAPVPEPEPVSEPEPEMPADTEAVPEPETETEFVSDTGAEETETTAYLSPEPEAAEADGSAEQDPFTAENTEQE